MITGAKRRRAGMAVPAPIAARRGLALATIAGGWSLAAVVVVGFAARPGLGLPPTTVDPLIVAECGACHFAYPPSLLPRASWAALLTGLDDHFGENATLPAETVAVIAARLEAGAAESADTRAANRFRLTAPDAPFTLTATPYWKRRHAGLEDTVFARAEIGGRGNCGACHGDAAAGRFHPGRIAIPSPSSEGSTP